jgi:FecR protein
LICRKIHLLFIWDSAFVSCLPLPWGSAANVMWFWLRHLALIALVALTLQPSICAAQLNIGSAAAVRNQVDGILNDQTRNLSPGSAVHSEELIRSGDASVGELVFLDRTRLSVGPKSEVRLDKFVYNPNRGGGSVVIDMTRGSYRFITGVQDPRNYEIKTPYATLGVRGTILEISLEGVEPGTIPPPDLPECRNYIRVRLVEGAFIATTTSGRTITVTNPNTVLTVCSDGNFQTTTSTQSILNFTPERFAEGPPPGGPGGGGPTTTAPASTAAGAGTTGPGTTGPGTTGPSGGPTGTPAGPTVAAGVDPLLLGIIAGIGGVIGLVAGEPTSNSPVQPPTVH